MLDHIYRDYIYNMQNQNRHNEIRFERRESHAESTLREVLATPAEWNRLSAADRRALVVNVNRSRERRVHNFRDRRRGEDPARLTQFINSNGPIFAPVEINLGDIRLPTDPPWHGFFHGRDHVNETDEIRRARDHERRLIVERQQIRQRAQLQATLADQAQADAHAEAQAALDALPEYRQAEFEFQRDQNDQRNNRFISVFTVENELALREHNGVRDALITAMQQLLPTIAFGDAVRISTSWRVDGGQNGPGVVTTEASAWQTLMNHNDIIPSIDALITAVDNSVEQAADEQSGMRWLYMERVVIEVLHRQLPAHARHIEIAPAFGKTVYNPVNTDDRCIVWSTVIALNHELVAKNKTRVSQYAGWISNDAESYSDDATTGARTITTRSLTFPTHISEHADRIDKFEVDNDLCLTIYTCDPDNYTSERTILRHGRRTGRSDKTRDVNLVLFERDNTAHVAAIYKIHRFLLPQSNSNFICLECRKTFKIEKSYNDHVAERCTGDNPSKIGDVERNYFPEAVLTKPQRVRRLLSPFVAVYDIETTKDPLTGAMRMLSYGMQLTVVRGPADGRFNFNYVSHFEAPGDPHEKVLIHFYADLLRLVKHCSRIAEDKDLRLKIDPQHRNEKATPETVCHICEKQLGDDAEKSHRDHDHFQPAEPGADYGLFRGFSHPKCNTHFRWDRKIMLFAHNGSSFDHLFILRGATRRNITAALALLGETATEGYIDYLVQSTGKTLPQNSCSVITATLFGVTLKDSRRFLMGSLDALMKSQVSLSIAEAAAREMNIDPKWTRQKLMFPHDACTGPEFYARGMPTREMFRDSLRNGAEISDDDWNRFVAFWEENKIQNCGELVKAYQRVDVAGLDDVITNTRIKWHNMTNLDMVNGPVSLPGASYDSFREDTADRFQIGLIPSEKIEEMFPVLGGVSYIGTRKQDFNVPGEQGYNPAAPTKIAVSYDCVSLYPSCMAEWTYPINNLKMLPEIDVARFTNEHVLALPVESDKHWQLRIDAHVPNVLHDYFNAYPPFAENLELPAAMLSSYQNDMGVCKGKRLCTHLRPVTGYSCDYRLVQWFIQKGIIVNVVAVVESNAAPIYRDWVNRGMEMRAATKCPLEKNLRKLQLNALYGQSLTKNFRHLEHKLHAVTNPRPLLWALRRGTTVDIIELNEDQYIISQKQTKADIKTPRHHGSTTLSLSKFHMLRSFYVFKDHLEAHGLQLEFTFTDTDSVSWAIIGSVGQSVESINTIVHSGPMGVLLEGANEGQKLKFKNEFQKVGHARQWVGLCSKVYSYDFYNNEQKATAKGVNSTTASTLLPHSRYVEAHSNVVLPALPTASFTHAGFRHRFVTGFRRSLNPFDAKRFVLHDGVQTLAHGHYRIPELQAEAAKK